MFISIDIGGTYIRIAYINAKKDLQNPLNWNMIEKFHVFNNFQKDFQNIVNTIKKFQTKNRDITKICIGVPGIFDKSTKKLIHIPSISDWNNQNLKNHLENEFFTKVEIMNDTAMAALGEAEFHKFKDDFLYINWGTGIGGAYVKKNNNIYEIKSFEPGHQLMFYNNKIYEFEKICAGKGIKNIFQKHPSKLKVNEWQKIIEIFAIGIINIISIRKSNFIMIGGGIAHKQKHLIIDIEKSINNKLPKIFKQVNVKLSALGDKSALYGGFIKIFSNYKI